MRPLSPVASKIHGSGDVESYDGVFDWSFHRSGQSTIGIVLLLQLLPILNKTHIPIKRMRDLLQSRGYTPEWKIREMKEMLHIYLVCLTPFHKCANQPRGARRKAQFCSLSFCRKRRTLPSILVGIDLYYLNMVGLEWIGSDGLASSTWHTSTVCRVDPWL